MYCLIAQDKGVGFLEFSQPRDVILTHDVTEVQDCLTRLREETEKGFYAAGFVAFEAAPAFDEAFVTHQPGSLPLVCFGIFEKAKPISPSTDGDAFSFESWIPSENYEAYEKKILAVKHHIAEGNTYQINYTFKLTSVFNGEPRAFFLGMQERVKARYAAYMELDETLICSFSPELFFTYRDGILVSKPMKGTEKRGVNPADDQKKTAWLAASEKNRAENVMIVDMIRNDMGRIADPGSVRVENLYQIEKHPYVFQMISTVKSNVQTGIDRIFQVLFPCASITGAPKVRTLEITSELEEAPRGIYTGAIGCIDPRWGARFSVGIRTLVLDRSTGKAEFGVGSGVVWDSDPASEYSECLLKANFLSQPQPDFKLIESLLWQPGSGYYLLDEHLERLAVSAYYFDFIYKEARVRDELTKAAEKMSGEGKKVRLLLSRIGEVEITTQGLAGVAVSDVRIGLAGKPVDSTDRFLYHKTTLRRVYEIAKASRPDCDDVILWNEKGEVTETCRANIVLEKNGELITPPVSCGLLGGTFRSHLLKSGKIREGLISKSDLVKSKKLFTINSVRRWMDAVLIPDK